jgi:hypothetical protein
MWYLKDGGGAQGKPEVDDLDAIKEQENRIMLQMMGVRHRCEHFSWEKIF